jgi:adenine/guanine phosphoribosyltransferase-like PRPP-binding protein
VPGSVPGNDAPWVASQLAMALRDVGLAGTVWPGLQRQFAVRRSATALAGERPTVHEHYESFSVIRPPAVIRRIVLIDDVITKGRTLLAAAARMQAQFPHTDIRAFALIRTLGFQRRVEHLIEPCQGVIRWAGGDARREP